VLAKASRGTFPLPLANVRSPDGANGSRECAPDDRLREIRDSRDAWPRIARSLSSGGASRRPVGCVPSMIDSLEVKVLYPSLMVARISKAQGRRREAGSEGSVEQSRGPIDKKRITRPARPDERAANREVHSHQSRVVDPTGVRPKAVDLTSGDLCCVPQSGLGPPQRRPDRSAEVSRRRSRRGDPVKA